MTKDEYIIEKGVPVPPKSSRRRYRFSELEVGESFMLKATDDLHRVRSAANAHGRKYNKKFTIRRTGEPGSERWMCWRLS